MEKMVELWYELAVIERDAELFPLQENDDVTIPRALSEWYDYCRRSLVLDGTRRSSFARSLCGSPETLNPRDDEDLPRLSMLVFFATFA